MTAPTLDGPVKSTHAERIANAQGAFKARILERIQELAATNVQFQDLPVVMWAFIEVWTEYLAACEVTFEDLCKVQISQPERPTREDLERWATALQDSDRRTAP